MTNPKDEKNYRPLTISEIETLKQQGCSADEWSNVLVAEGFKTNYVSNVAFSGSVLIGAFEEMVTIEEGFERHSGIRNATLCDVTIGDNCLIENISLHICRYDIGDNCYIAGVGRMVSGEGTTFGQGATIAVLNEAGQGNIILYPELTSQMAAFMVQYAEDEDVWNELRELIREQVESNRPHRGVIGDGVRIINCRDITNTLIGEGAELSGASRIADSTIAPEAFIGDDVIIENTMVQSGASIVIGAKVESSLVGEACHIGKGFTAENSLFFANSHMDCGEACAAFCGPFSVSHHKSTLLIGVMVSFYNAGSATNYSNHAYKTGPIHTGTLARGSKTASGAHLLLPATIGPFSMCMGKICSHPDTSAMPFSYLIASNRDTLLMPGYNLATAGTARDVEKWKSRDRRQATARNSIVNDEWLNPCTISAVIEGKLALENLLESGENDYNGCIISDSHARKGIEMYDIALRMFLGTMVREIATDGVEEEESSIGVGQWTDLAGLITPKEEVKRLADDLRAGYINNVLDIEERFQSMHSNYRKYAHAFAHALALETYGIDTLTEAAIDEIIADGETATETFHTLAAEDAERDKQMARTWS